MTSTSTVGSVLSLSASGVAMLGAAGACRLRARITKTTSPLAIPASRLRRRPAPRRRRPSSGDAAEDLHELPIAVGVVLEARAIADSGVGRLACQRWARSALTRAVAARLPMRRQACW